MVPAVQLGGAATVGGLVQAAANARINAGGLTALNIAAFVNHMYANIAH